MYASTSSATRMRRTCVAQLEDACAIGDRLDRVERLGGGLVAAGDLPLARPRSDSRSRPARRNRSSWPGQRERALELDRVLGREHDERVGQRPGPALDRDLPLLHRLEQGRLRSRRGPVDLVDEQDVGEHRPGREAERAALEQARAGDVDGQEVGRALDAVVSSLRARATARASSVLPVPGTSSMRRGRRRAGP